MEDWDYEEYLEELRYLPQQNRYFEMWQFDVGIRRSGSVDLA